MRFPGKRLTSLFDRNCREPLGSKKTGLRRALSALAICAMGAVVIAYGRVSGSQGPRPKAVVDRIRYDLGTVFAGEQPTHTFVIRNEGTAPLTLVDKKRDVESANIGSSEIRASNSGGSNIGALNIGVLNEDTALLRPVVAYARASLGASEEMILMPISRARVEPVPT